MRVKEIMNAGYFFGALMIMVGTRPLVVLSKEQHTFITIHLTNGIQWPGSISRTGDFILRAGRAKLDSDISGKAAL